MQNSFAKQTDSNRLTGDPKRSLLTRKSTENGRHFELPWDMGCFGIHNHLLVTYCATEEVEIKLNLKRDDSA